MANFNLLPWREKAREEKKKQFFISIGAAVATAALGVFLGHNYMQNQIEYQQARNQFLQTEIQKVERKIKEIEKLDETRQALLDRIKVIEELQSTRPAIVHLFDEMVSALPKGMYLTHLLQRGTQIGIEGKAESNARVSSYMNKLNASPWLSSSNLQIISVEKDKEGETQLRSFRLQVTQLLKARETEEKKTISVGATSPQSVNKHNTARKFKSSKRNSK